MSIEKFKKDIQHVNITAAVTKKDLYNIDKFSDEYSNQKCVKFIPASGAATRMFKDLYTFLDDRIETEFVHQFFDNLEQFAFYKDIEEFIINKDINKDSVEGKIEIIDSIVKSDLNYSVYPKALIKMHSYDFFSTTPLDEHIFEGEQYLNKEDVDLHFTIAKEHEEMFNNYIDKVLKGKDHLTITYSFQKDETNTIAVDKNNNPFLLENGDVFYRPGGHGALLENLNDLEAEVIFIKNIDNVCHRSHLDYTINSKKELASAGLEVKKQIDQHLISILSDDYDMDEVENFIKVTLNILPKNELTKERALYFLDRPLRVCGMVKNNGEPGGGPFVVDNGDYYDLQICEKSEIDLNDKEKIEILNSSEYFNPVDLVCYVNDHNGDKYNLMEYSNEDRYFITEKTYKGEKLKALEYPGLWNGSMHNWNTLFVEVSTETFNPVKNVNDLLRIGHRETVSVR